MSAMDSAHALVVGIADYANVVKLPDTVLNDARAINKVLGRPDVCGYPAANVRLLVDGQATQASLRAELTDLAARTGVDSTVFIYFSGHGGQIKSGTGAGEYLLPVNTRVDWSTSPPQIVASTAISGAEFSAALLAIPARKVVVVFDCCHSSGIGQIKGGLPSGFRAGLPESYYDRLAAGRGRVIMASSRETEFSWALADATNSLFTQHLLAGLRGAAPSRDGTIRVFELFEYVHPLVTAAVPNQHPVLQVKVEENFPLALYLGGQMGEEPAEGDAGEFRYDVYISWVRSPSDKVWFSKRLLPLLREAGLRLAMTGRVDEPGVPVVIGIQRAVELARRTLVILSRDYLRSTWATLENVTAAHLSVEERRARLVIVPIDESLLTWERYLNEDVPLGLRMLGAVDVLDDVLGTDNLVHLVDKLRQPLPRLFY